MALRNQRTRLAVYGPYRPVSSGHWGSNLDANDEDVAELQRVERCPRNSKPPPARPESPTGLRFRLTVEVQSISEDERNGEDYVEPHGPNEGSGRFLSRFPAFVPCMNALFCQQ